MKYISISLTMAIILSSTNLSWSQVFNQTLDMNSLKIPCEEFKDPKATIKKVYSQQMRNYSPNSMDITDDYIAWSKEQTSGTGIIAASTGGSGKTTISFANSVYYKTIIDLRVIKKKGRYEIRYANKANGKKYFIYIKDKDLAIEGYSAISCMMQRQTNQR